VITDDLSGLFRPGAAGGLDVLQGLVVDWTAGTGANLIDLGGGVAIENVPLLISGSTVLQAGDLVLVLATPLGAFVLGKVTEPGPAGTVPTWSADISTVSSAAAAAQSTAAGAAADAAAALAASTARRFATGNWLSAASTSLQTTAVAFPVGRFTATPIVVATARTSAAAVMQVSVSGESTTGFNLHFQRNAATATNIGWIAVQI
jgi:hypothetical protein